MTLMRTDTWLVTATIDGSLTPSPDGVWDTFKGGDIDSTADVYHAGGMKDQQAVGGQATISTITIDKALNRENDWAQIQNLMATAVGNASITIHRQPLDQNKNPFGTPLVYTGIVKSLAPGDTDSSKSDIQMWTLTAVVSGPIGTA